MRHRRERFNDEISVGRIVVKILVMIITIVGIGIGAIIGTAFVRGYMDGKKEIEATQMEMDRAANETLKNGFITTYFERSATTRGGETVIVESYIVLYDGYYYLIEFDTRDDSCITYQNYYVGEQA